MSLVFLVVDDNGTDRAGALRQLERSYPQATLLEAAGGRAAMRLLEERRMVPSLVLLDYAMPEASGIEFLSDLRHARWLERVPVAILSEPIADRLVVQCYRLGACEFLAKPLRTFELRQCVRDFARPAEQMASATLVPPSGGARVNAA